MSPAALLAYVPTQYLPWVTAAITIASILGTIIPPPPAAPKGVLQQAWSVSYRVVSWVSLAFGHAQNSTDPNKGK
jgi:hypothetical protein